MRELPARERVGAETRVEQAQRALGARVVEVGEVLAQLRRGQHPLVGEGARRQAGHVEVLAVVDAARADCGLEALADHVQLALERGLVGGLVTRRDEHVVHHGLDRARRLAEAAVVGRHAPPADEVLPLLANDHREDQLGQRRRLRIGGAEEHANGVLPGGRQARQLPAVVGLDDPAERALALEQLVRDLEQDARAVARVGLGTGGATMLHALERAQRTIDEVV